MLDVSPIACPDQDLVGKTADLSRGEIVPLESYSLRLGFVDRGEQLPLPRVGGSDDIRPAHVGGVSVHDNVELEHDEVSPAHLLRPVPVTDAVDLGGVLAGRKE